MTLDQIRALTLRTLIAVVCPAVGCGVLFHTVRLAVGGIWPTGYELVEDAVLLSVGFLGVWLIFKRRSVGKLVTVDTLPWVDNFCRMLGVLSAVAGVVIGLSAALGDFETIRNNAIDVCHKALELGERDWATPLPPEVQACVSHGKACRSADDESIRDALIIGDPIVNCVRARLGR